jgi:ribosomal peptide maturation radical SAM protein 1
MDGLPDPDFDDFFRQRVHRSNLEKEDLLIMMETSRGCWWGEKSHCLFCGVNDSIMRFRTKSPDRMIGEIDRLVARYGEYSRYLVTTDCCLPPEHLRSTIPRLAEKGLGVRLFYETKVNLKKDQVKVMRQAGIQEMQPGIESLSTPILKKIGKGQTALQSVQLLKWCAEFGIVPNWNYIYGYPGEQPEDYDRGLHILRAITHLQPPLKEGRVRFDRFSPYQTDPHRFGIRALEPYPSYRFVFSGLDSQSISDLAYYFVAEFDGEGRIAEWSREIENIVSLWKKNADQSALFFIDDNSKLLICDFRPGAADPFLVLQGHQRTLYKACDRIRSRSVLLGILAAESGKDLNDTEIDALLKPLLDRRIMLEEEGCCLALAVSLDHEYFPPVELWGVFPDVLARWDEMKAAKT